MGIESDQLVFDYLSRVADLAAQAGLTSRDRAQLVARLRADVDAARSGGPGRTDDPAAVRRILRRLGAPDTVVAGALPSRPTPPAGPVPAGPAPRAAGPSSGPERPQAPDAPQGRLPRLLRRPAGPSRPERGLDPEAAPEEAVGDAGGQGNAEQDRPGHGGHPDRAAEPGRGAGPGRDGAGERERPAARRGPLWLSGPRRAARPAGGAAQRPVPPPRTAAPPHLAGVDELGADRGGEGPDWWQTEPRPFGAAETVPGFVGGIEIDAMRTGVPPRAPETVPDGPSPDKAAPPAPDAGDAAAGAGGQPAPPSRGGLLRRLGRGLRGKPEGRAGWTSLGPLVLLAVALLVVGAVIGSWWALLAGWFLAYTSRRLTPAQAKSAALGVPGTVAAGLVVWLWGRVAGRWGEPVAEGAVGRELLAGLPGAVRVAAVASALYLLWCVRRRPR
ncbi:hypothetical protein ACFV3R_07415 [Streptomyces sp. NPDC059740]|uniref:hypothetical protein n=1 Tax=Streptomyces sp. NPDC059740 TaxID=3346926 RepID=UPI00364D4CD3